MCTFVIAFFLTILIISDINIVYSWNLKNEKNKIDNINKFNQENFIISQLINESNKLDEIDTKQQDDKKEKTTKINIYRTNKWRIKIPSLELDAPISQGTDSEALRRTVGHFEETDKWERKCCSCWT